MRHLAWIFVVACGVDGPMLDTGSSEFLYGTTPSEVPTEDAPEGSSGISAETEDTSLCTIDEESQEVIEACIEAFEISAGYDHGDADLASLETQCRDESGTDCDAEHWISLEAAVCTAEGLNDLILYSQPIGKSTATLYYNPGFATATWRVRSSGLHDGPYTQSSHTAYLHATTGCRMEAWTTLTMY